MNKPQTNSLPQFSKINIDKIEAELEQLLTENRQAIQRLLQQKNTFSWDNLMFPLESLEDKLDQFWSSVSHLNAVMDSDKLRQVYNACIPKLTQYSTELAHNKALYQAICSIKESSEFQQLNYAQQKVIDNNIRDFKLAGVALNEQDKKQFAKLSEELAQLTTRFEQNVLDATHGFKKHITDEQELAGIPEHARQLAKQKAEKEQQSGWIFTLDIPSYLAIMMHADSAALREEIYHAYVTRASELGPNAGQWDNAATMMSILEKRLQLAQLLRFNNFAERSLATKMLKKTDQVLNFLEQLLEKTTAQAKQDLASLQAFAKQHYAIEELKPWDIAYISEKLRQHDYALSQEELRPYFPEYKVKAGLFQIINKLFGITITEVKDADTWHKDAHCYALSNAQGELISYCYLDLYARPHKRGGAWMDDFRGRRLLDNQSLQTPVAFVTCNFNAPVGDDPALFTHDEVVTLFHEFGHSLQHMLTKINYADVAGINGVPWDAVEVASQFLENWAYEKESLQLIAEHYQSKQALPDELFQRLTHAKNFQSALQMLRQLEFSLFDFKLHLHYNPNEKDIIQHTLNEVRQQTALIPVPEFNRFQNSFSHIFAGGYAAGYYSYKWAEVMACDAFSLFKEKGVFDQATSQKFLTTILEQGGAVEPLELFVKFRGREPRVEALLEALEINA